MTSVAGDASFRTTRWSVVRRARADDARGRRALAELCELYWYPVYAFVRRRGHDADAARDLTQGFFAAMLARGDLGKGDPERGRFRAYLRTSVDHYVANERARARAVKRGGGVVPQSLEIDLERAEQRYAAEPVDCCTPERLFERRWALDVLRRALDALAERFAERDRSELFERLRGFLEADASPPPYRELAGETGLSESALKVTVHRMRREFADLVRAEVADTIDDGDDADDEFDALLAALSVTADGNRR